MSLDTSTRTISAAGGTLEDFIALMKPRVMSLVLFTAFVGMVAAPGRLHPALAVIALVAIAAGAGAAGALNMWFDADIDARMARTALRPVPRGAVSPDEALAFGLILAVFSITTLGLTVNWTAAALLALTIAFYVVVYTMWLKRRTPQNIVIGGAAGSLPPMIGWAAVTGGIGIESMLLFLIIFLWTPPHFWALALLRQEDFRRAGLPMLPVVAGETATQRQIVIYSVLLALVSAAPAFTGLGGPLYMVLSAVLGLAFVALALKVRLARSATEMRAAARHLFSYSVLYLFLLFSIVLVEHTARLWAA